MDCDICVGEGKALLIAAFLLLCSFLFVVPNCGWQSRWFVVFALYGGKIRNIIRNKLITTINSIQQCQEVSLEIGIYCSKLPSCLFIKTFL